MDNQNYIHIVNDYYIGADKYCIILYKRGEISGEGHNKAKPENIGKEIYNPIGYYSDLSSLGKGLSRRHLFESISDENVTDLKELSNRMVDFIGRIERIEEDYLDLLRSKMGDKDHANEEQEEEQA